MINAIKLFLLHRKINKHKRALVRSIKRCLNQIAILEDIDLDTDYTRLKLDYRMQLRNIEEEIY